MAKKPDRSFRARLAKYPGKGGWTFALIPKRHTLPVTRGWGRTPVDASVDGSEWRTSVWRSKDGGSVLAVPVRARGSKGHGDFVRVQLSMIPDDE